MRAPPAMLALCAASACGVQLRPRGPERACGRRKSLFGACFERHRPHPGVAVGPSGGPRAAYPPPRLGARVARRCVSRGRGHSGQRGPGRAWGRQKSLFGACFERQRARPASPKALPCAHATHIPPPGLAHALRAAVCPQGAAILAKGLPDVRGAAKSRFLGRVWSRICAPTRAGQAPKCHSRQPRRARQTNRSPKTGVSCLCVRGHMAECAKMRYFGPARGPRLRVWSAHTRVPATKIPLQETETALKGR